MKLPQEERSKALKDIQAYFNEEREEPIGVVAATDILNFFMDTLGSRIYNQALDDARRWFAERMENIEIDYTLLYQNDARAR